MEAIVIATTLLSCALTWALYRLCSGLKDKP